MKWLILFTTPLAVGGGIKNFEQVQQLLDRGADKIILNSAAIDKPSLIEKIANSYGSQCIVSSIDVRLNNSEYDSLGRNEDKKKLI